MCGNFGLLLLREPHLQSNISSVGLYGPEYGDEKVESNQYPPPSNEGKKNSVLPSGTAPKLLNPLLILREQTSCTEVRGGQAGGISCLTFQGPDKDYNPRMTRVRRVARKRYNLADDLVGLFKQQGGAVSESSTTTFIGHTRFATSSVNVDSELHPHEWVKFHDEMIWYFCKNDRRFKKVTANVGIHITHNGDFDCLAGYDNKLTNEDVGLWLERVHRVHNNLLGDSPKIAGLMDLFRVQGRWAAAARLSYLRTVSTSLNDVAYGEHLEKSASNSFAEYSYWQEWERFFDLLWQENVNNIIMVKPASSGAVTYQINQAGVKQLVSLCMSTTANRPAFDNQEEFASFINVTIRGFLYSDLYTALTEFLTRAEGSFGIQVHSTLEPGVVVIASKGQPMSMSFDPHKPIALFGSEAEAIAVPVDEDGGWLKSRIDLDSKGEIMRIGCPRALDDGTYSKKQSIHTQDFSKRSMLTPVGIEIRSYILKTASEVELETLLSRTKQIITSPPSYDPSKDLVAKDLADIPKVLSSIECEFRDENSANVRATLSLGSAIVESLRNRQETGNDYTDLLIGGVESSLWIAEQFAVDLRSTFPSIRITTISANKLLSVGGEATDKILESVLPRKISERTCVLLISQSGQTFPTLHATRKLSRFTKGNVWILTGCYNSKMEDALRDAYDEMNLSYQHDHIIDNLSGSRPSEPTTVALVSSVHTLTWMLITLAQHVLSINKDKLKNNKDSRRAGRETMLQTQSSLLSISCTQNCLDDIKSLINSCLVKNSCDLVGYDMGGNKYLKTSAMRQSLLNQGKAWGDHVAEPWNVLVLVGAYVILSVTLGLPLFGVISNFVFYVIDGNNADSFGALSFSPLSYSPQKNKFHMIIGIVIQFMDALWFVFLGKIFTWILRFLGNRPIFARHGKRTLVIVDTSWVHQCTEIFVSKLFSQAYSFVSLDVHGASGLDHFVHRFTHRVVRDVMLAVGRPDGRLFSLAKSESSILLAAKQAAFIQNPAYQGLGSGPDVVSIGHNPYIPNLGDVHKSIILASDTRGKFVDEILYDRLYMSDFIVSGSIIKSMSPKMTGDKCGEGSLAGIYGAHHIDRIIHRINAGDEMKDMMAKAKKMLSKKKGSEGNAKTVVSKSNNPADLLSFEYRLDAPAKEVNGLQANAQQFYENRIASLERYIAFCVMFHELVLNCHKPWLTAPWDFARSQSNLRVATTASPIASENSEAHVETTFFKKMKRDWVVKSRGYRMNF